MPRPYAHPILQQPACTRTRHGAAFLPDYDAPERLIWEMGLIKTKNARATVSAEVLGDQDSIVAAEGDADALAFVVVGQDVLPVARAAHPALHYVDS